MARVHDDEAVDFDLLGLVGIRVIAHDARDPQVIERQFGPFRRPLDRQPDITVRFVKRLELSGPLRYIGLRDAAFTEDGFIVIKPLGRRESRALIAFDRIGKGCEIICESGASGVPLLVAIVNHTALAKGVVPLHGSAFTYRDSTFLVCGWGKGGKTETLLAFMAHGAEYVGDDWVYIDPATGRVSGLLAPIKIWDWHVAHAAQLARALSARERTRMTAFRIAQRLTRVGPARLMGAAARHLERQRYAYVNPDRLFSTDAGRLSATVDRVVLVISRDVADTRLEEIAAEEIVDRMVFSNAFERLDLLAYYLKYRFAFPMNRVPLVEDATELERSLLTKAFGGRTGHVLYHPFPAPIPALFDALSGLADAR